ncbi:hypothetical protein KB1_01150 [Cutibacterium modestum]|uniref:Uncharacterized protein n=1 Tax=Cutibacterium modestum TaxID=2559073 RepID=A0AAD1NUJ6_9ACTN|nr:hypothetical protein KB1_01150 [Cutibacterium modestum]
MIAQEGGAAASMVYDRGNNVSPGNRPRALADLDPVEGLYNLSHHRGRVIGRHDGAHHRDTGHTGSR